MSPEPRAPDNAIPQGQEHFSHGWHGSGGESCKDLTQRRRDSQRVAESPSSLRFSAFLCVSALEWVWLRLWLGCPLLLEELFGGRGGPRMGGVGGVGHE